MKKFIWIQIILGLFFAHSAFSQNDTIENPLAAVDTLKQDFGLFTSDDLLHLALRFDVREYTRKKPKDGVS